MRKLVTGLSRAQRRGIPSGQPEGVRRLTRVRDQPGSVGRGTVPAQQIGCGKGQPEARICDCARFSHSREERNGLFYDDAWMNLVPSSSITKRSSSVPSDAISTISNVLLSRACACSLNLALRQLGAGGPAI